MHPQNVITSMRIFLPSFCSLLFWWSRFFQFYGWSHFRCRLVEGFDPLAFSPTLIGWKDQISYCFVIHVTWINVVGYSSWLCTDDTHVECSFWWEVACHSRGRVRVLFCSLNMIFSLLYGWCSGLVISVILNNDLQLQPSFDLLFCCGGY